MSKICLKQYIRDTAPEYASDGLGNVYRRVGRPRKIGVLVSTGPGKMGFSVISPYENLEDCRPIERVITIEKNGNKEEKKIFGAEKIWSNSSIWKFGTDLATERSEGKQKNPEIIPNPILKQVRQFQNRMKRYYK